MKLLSGFLLLAVASFLPAQPSQQSSSDAKQEREDPAGWNKAKWGMTAAELIRAFEGKAVWSKTLVEMTVDEDFLVIQTWTIGATDYQIRFQFDKDGKLEGVSIVPHKIPPKVPLPPTPRGVRQTPSERALLEEISKVSPPVFGQLNVLLTEKYGKPDVQTSKTESGNTTEETTWILKTTIIRLWHSYNTRFGMNRVMLFYKKVDIKTRDSL